MLQIYIPKGEFWDERNEEFFYSKEFTLRLEHSLVSISKWEAKNHIPFLETKLNGEQLLDYIRCMTIDNSVPNDVYKRLTQKDLVKILEYMNNPMTASKVTDINNKVGRSEFVTSELIYYWMTKFNIPVEFEKWHINRLMMLIRICMAKESPPRKLTRQEQFARLNAINARNKARYGSKGRPS